MLVLKINDNTKYFTCLMCFLYLMNICEYRGLFQNISLSKLLLGPQEYTKYRGLFQNKKTALSKLLLGPKEYTTYGYILTIEIDRNNCMERNHTTIILYHCKLHLNQLDNLTSYYICSSR